MKIVCFHNPEEENGYLSNWYPSQFIMNNITLHQRKFLYINQIQICISIKRQKGMTLIRHAFSFLSFSNLLINNLHVQ